MYLTFSKTFSEELGKNIGVLIGALFGLFFFALFAIIFTIVLIVLLLLKKFLFRQNRIYSWIMRIVSVLIFLISSSLAVRAISSPAPVFALLVAIPVILSIYCIFRR